MKKTRTITTLTGNYVSGDSRDFQDQGVYITHSTSSGHTCIVKSTIVSDRLEISQNIQC